MVFLEVIDYTYKILVKFICCTNLLLQNLLQHFVSTIAITLMLLQWIFFCCNSIVDFPLTYNLVEEKNCKFTCFNNYYGDNKWSSLIRHKEEGFPSNVGLSKTKMTTSATLSLGKNCPHNKRITKLVVLYHHWSSLIWYFITCI